MKRTIVDRYGTKWWYNILGKLHNETGPAVENYEGGNLYYLNDKKLTEQEWIYQTREMKLQQILSQ